MRNYPCRQPLAICYLLLASSFLFRLYASCFKLSASSFLRSLPLLSTLCALCSQPSASCFLRTLPLSFTLYSLLTASALSALCPQPSAFCSLSFNRHPPKNGLPGSCIGGGQSRSSSTHRKKRVRSATSRRTPTLSVYYQLAFFTPGMRPFEAISRNWIRLMPN